MNFIETFNGLYDEARGDLKIVLNRLRDHSVEEYEQLTNEQLYKFINEFKPMMCKPMMCKPMMCDDLHNFVRCIFYMQHQCDRSNVIKLVFEMAISNNTHLLDSSIAASIDIYDIYNEDFRESQMFKAMCDAIGSNIEQSNRAIEELIKLRDNQHPGWSNVG
jgi:hypothetical protein